MGINVALAKEKGLDESKYDKLVKNYMYLLEYYINSKVNLSKYDELIKNSDLCFGINKKYQSLNEYFSFNYIFLINNLFVEKLSKKDLELLDSFNNIINNELIDLVDRTYKEVIYDNYVDGKYLDNVIKVCYGALIPSNMVDNNALVFKIYFGKNKIDLSGEDFIELTEKQYSFLDDIAKKIKNDIKNKINTNCEVLIEKDIY